MLVILIIVWALFPLGCSRTNQTMVKFYDDHYVDFKNDFPGKEPLLCTDTLMLLNLQTSRWLHHFKEESICLGDLNHKSIFRLIYQNRDSIFIIKSVSPESIVIKRSDYSLKWKESSVSNQNGEIGEIFALKEVDSFYNLNPETNILCFHCVRTFLEVVHFGKYHFVQRIGASGNEVEFHKIVNRITSLSEITK